MGSLRINIGSAFNKSCMQKPMVVDLVSMKICLLHVYSMLRANAVGCEVFMDIISNTAGYSRNSKATKILSLQATKCLQSAHSACNKVPANLKQVQCIFLLLVDMQQHEVVLGHYCM